MKLPRIDPGTGAAGALVTVSLWQMWGAYNSTVPSAAELVDADPTDGHAHSQLGVTEANVVVFSLLVGGSMSLFTRSWIPITLTGVGLGLLSYQRHSALMAHPPAKDHP